MTVKNVESCVGPLVGLGFTELEAAVYAYLVQSAPATGYRVAQAINKPAANIYQALTSLERKGAVIADEGASKLYRSVPPGELLGQIRRAFDRQEQEAAEALSRLRPPPSDDGVYALTTAEQAYERCRAMLSRAEQAVLLDVFPGLLEQIRPEVEATARRGVRVVVEVYGPTEVDGAETVPALEDVRSEWPGEWLNLVVDGRELLMSFFGVDGERVHQAIWSESPFLCLAYHGALTKEILCARYARAIAEASDLASLREAVAAFPVVGASDTLGYRALGERFGWWEDNAAGAGIPGDAA